MSVDGVAVASLVFTIVGVGVAGAAAYFAWRSPSREDLARVEAHLRIQTGRDALDARGREIHMRVQGNAWADDPMTLHLTLQESEFSLSRIDLVSEHNFFSGSFPCTRESGQEYVAVITAQAFGQWFQSGRAHQQITHHMVWIRAILSFSGETTEKLFPVMATSILQDKTERQLANHNAVNGEC